MLSEAGFYEGCYNFKRCANGVIESVPRYSYETRTALYDVVVLDGKVRYGFNGKQVEQMPIHRQIEEHFGLTTEMKTEVRQASSWYVKFPSDAYGLGPVRFVAPVDEQAALQWARDWSHNQALVLDDSDDNNPNRIQVWPGGAG